jgi:murein DD-endopeptidase MepM/ murein hydrolase activator NlpD
MPFPLPFVPPGYKTGGRKFGASRPNGRKHAGSDLIAPLGTPIFAVADGFVLDEPRDFYHGTWALSINHGAFVVRYCEIRKPSPEDIMKLRRGARVRAGDVIAHVGKMRVDSMLHFEVYAGTLTGPLSVKKNKPYERRADLVNSADLLDRFRHNVLMNNAPIALVHSEGVRR